MFRSKYERVVTSTNPGSFTKNVYGSEYDKQHRLVVVKKGEEDLKAYINSFAESVNLHVILKRFQNGDRKSLIDRIGDYVDISAIPDNMNELMAVSKNLESGFERLPASVKEKFNNNVQEFKAIAGTEEWLEKLQGSEYSIMREEDKAIQAVTKINQDIVNHVPVHNPGDVIIDDPVVPEETPKRGVTK